MNRSDFESVSEKRNGRLKSYVECGDARVTITVLCVKSNQTLLGGYHRWRMASKCISDSAVESFWKSSNTRHEEKVLLSLNFVGRHLKCSQNAHASRIPPAHHHFYCKLSTSYGLSQFLYWQQRHSHFAGASERTMGLFEYILFSQP